MGGVCTLSCRGVTALVRRSRCARKTSLDGEDNYCVKVVVSQ